MHTTENSYLTLFFRYWNRYWRAGKL